MTQGPFGLNVGIQIKEERERKKRKRERKMQAKNEFSQKCNYLNLL